IELFNPSSIATPAECSRIFRDSKNELQFGRGLLNGRPDWEKVRKKAQEDRTCEYNPARDYADCKYIDEEGVATHVYGSSIVLKEIRNIDSAKTTILGISKSDTLADVLKKFSSLDPKFPHWTIVLSESNVVITTGDCLRDSRDSNWGIEVIFDREYR